MVESSQNFVSYDNPQSLSDLSARCIVQNIEHFVNKKNILGKEYFLWKENIVLSDTSIEQIFQANIAQRGEIDNLWITLFLGSRSRAQQFVNFFCGTYRTCRCTH